MLSDNNLRAQLEKVEEQTGVRPAQLDAGGDLPELLAHVWVWFLELSAVRVQYRPIGHGELLAFFALYGIDPMPIEIDAIKALDREWMIHKANTLGGKK